MTYTIKDNNGNVVFSIESNNDLINANKIKYEKYLKELFKKINEVFNLMPSKIKELKHVEFDIDENIKHNVSYFEDEDLNKVITVDIFIDAVFSKDFVENKFLSESSPDYVKEINQFITIIKTNLLKYTGVKNIEYSDIGNDSVDNGLSMILKITINGKNIN